MRISKRATTVTLALTTTAVVVTAAVVHSSGAGGAADAEIAAGGGGYCVDMPDAIGLYPGNPVTQMGFRVGKVDSVQQRGDHVRVDFELDAGRRYPADVRVVTRSKSLLADRSLELVGNYTTGPALRPTECVPMSRSYTPKSISEIAGSAADFIDALSTAGDGSVQGAIGGVHTALDGTGAAMSAMLSHAAAAAAGPDQVTADIGASIMNMAPLTENALREWDRIGSILDRMPQVAAEGTELFRFVARFDRGIGWLVAVIYDIQRKYGAELWPIMHGPVADVIRLAATRAPDLAHLYGTIPSVVTAVNYQEQSTGGLSVPFRPPSVPVDPVLCGLLGPHCENNEFAPGTVNLLSLVAWKAAT
ncbi:MlaD family protein [Nocardia carnea]|uniref:MlaD family protein n=1 Tax=Nocardia carnea TaxID=37328 RepID=A0ABW7TWZ8_9NOCA|nr:MlaD family protein [Nocardia carnea]